MIDRHINKLIISTIILLNFVITGCFRSVCPDQPIYHVFTKDELANNLWINIDSAMNVQQKLVMNKAYYQYYELDTLNYLDEKNDTIPILIHNVIRSGNNVCKNYPMVAASSITPLKTCFIKGLIYQMEKTILTSDPIEFSFNFELDDQSYGNTYKLNDTIKIDFGFTNSLVDKSKQTYVIPSIASVTIKNITIANCIKFLFLDKFKNEILVVYYSNNYGFVKITKNKQYEITRIL